MNSPPSSDRLSFRMLQSEDCHVIATLAGHPEISRTTTEIPHPYSDELAKEWLATHKTLHDSKMALILGILNKKDGQILGVMSLVDISQLHGRAELGYWLGYDYWGQGFMSEAASALVAWGFSEMKLHRIFANTMINNTRSESVLTKIGFREEGLLREHIYKDGKFVDVKSYGILASN